MVVVEDGREWRQVQAALYERKRLWLSFEYRRPIDACLATSQISAILHGIFVSLGTYLDSEITYYNTIKTFRGFPFEYFQ